MRLILQFVMLLLLSCFVPLTASDAVSSPDLSFLSQGELSVNGEQLTIVNLKVKNTGTTTSKASYVGYYLSSDENITKDDIYLGRDYVEGLLPNEVSTEDFMVNLATRDDISEGSYFVGVLVDYNDAVDEASENNNAGHWTTPKVVIGGKPNLICKGLGEIFLDDLKLRINWAKISNNGNAAAGASKTGFYLSKDEDFHQSEDIFLGSVNIQALQPGEFQMMPQFDVNLANLDIPAGEYFVGYIIDYLDDVMESNEEDNKSCGFNHPKVIIESEDPNLVCGNLGDVKFNASNLSLEIENSTIRNNGDGDSQKARVAVVLSEDDNVNANDLIIAARFIDPIAAGGSISLGSFDIDLSSFDLDFGTYRIGLIIDLNGQVRETSEGDNICVFSEKIVINGDPNLVCGDLGDLDFSFEDLKLAISGTEILNIGTEASAKFRIAIVLSEDGTITSNDLLLSARFIDPIAAGGSTTLGDFNIDLSNFDLDFGEYFVGLIIDLSGQVSESNESDNTCKWTKKVVINGDPDLGCLDRGDLIVNDDDSFSVVGLKVQNFGTSTAGESQVGFYLSLDEEFSDEDELIGTFDIGELAPGEFATAEEPIDLDVTTADLTSGVYNFLVVIDHTDLVDETDETDNDDCMYDITLTINPGKPDLICAARGEIVLENGLDIYLSWTEVKNVGDTKAGGSVIGYFLSEDTNFTTDDYLFATQEVGMLEPGESFIVEDAIYVDLRHTGLEKGFYYVGVIMDYLDEVHEEEEDNNTCFWDNPRIFIPKKGDPNLVCLNVGDLEIDDEEVKVTGFTVLNDGEERAPTSKVEVYFSTNQTITTSDIEVLTLNVPSLEPGETAAFAFTLDIDDLDLNPGDFFLGFLLDADNEVAESNEDDNNSCVFPQKIEIPAGLPNLICASEGQVRVEGTKITIENLRVKNDGEAASTVSKVGFYLSTNQTISTNDILIGGRTIPALQPGATATISMFMLDVADMGISPGTYFIGTLIDYENTVDEEDEGDNNDCFIRGKKVVIPQPHPNLTCKDRGHIDINGTKIRITGTRVMNSGDGSSVATKVTYYLSTNRTFTTSDIAIGSVNLPALAPGQVANLGVFNTDVESLDLAPGTYFVGFIIDPLNVVKESNEDDNNNCHYDGGMTMEPKKPNLTCKDRGEISVSDHEVEISWARIINEGPGKSEVAKVTYYISTNSTISTSDIAIGTVSIPALHAGEVYTLPKFKRSLESLNLAVGSYFIGFFIDSQKTVEETNESDNSNCPYGRVIHIVPKKPNLTCKDRGEISINGTKIQTSWIKVINEGPGSSAATKVTFYLSTNQTFTVNDIAIGSVNLPALAAGQVVTLPTFNTDVEDLDLQPGSYFVGFIIDPFNAVHETDESDNNNCHYSNGMTVQPKKPNLACKSRGEIAAYGSTITISWARATNNGQGAAPASKVGYYLSKNTTFDESDFLIGTNTLPALSPGQTVTVNPVTINLSSFNLPPGEYFIGYVFDYNDQVHETNEHDNNDCFFTAPKVIVHPPKPDLECKSVGEISIHNDYLTVSWSRIINTGGSSSGGFYVSYYVSKDQYFTTADTKLGQVYVNSLAPNQVATLPTFNKDLSSLGLTAGTYFVGIIIDTGNRVAESDESNNTCFFNHPTYTVNPGKPDLKCKSLGEISVNGSNIDLSWIQVMNSGHTASSSTRIRYYLSTNSTITTNDFALGSSNVPALGVGQSTTISPFSVDAATKGVPPGTYFIGYFIDDQNYVHESNEDNNTCVWDNKRVTISAGKPNLTLKQGSGHLSTSGSTLNVSNVQVINNGASKAGSSQLGYYLSTDNNITTNDILVGEDFVGELHPGEISTESASINISHLNLPSGYYYFGFIIDYKRQVMESNEHDNDFVFNTRLQITNNSNNTKPDLKCHDTGTFTYSSSTKKVNIRGLKVKNDGDKASTATSVGFYLSTNLSYSNVQDKFVGSVSVPALSPGQIATINIEKTIPHDVPDGTYYLLYVVDYQNYVTESDENNNDCSYTYKKITISNGSGNGGGNNGGNNVDCACNNYLVNSYCEDFESYSTGKLGNASGCIRTASGSGGGNDDATIASNSDNKYLQIFPNNTNNEQNVYMMIGNRNSGLYEYNFKMWVFPHQKGYYCGMHTFGNNGNGSEAFRVHFSDTGRGHVEQGGNKLFFQFPRNQWFDVRNIMDFDNDRVRLLINGVQAATWKLSSTVTSNNSSTKNMAAFNFRPMESDYIYYIDDVEFKKVDRANDGEVENRSTPDASSASMTFYPNPVKDLLTIEIETPNTADVTIELTNAMGQIVKQIRQTDVAGITQNFDVSDLSSGMYYIKAQIGDQRITRSVVVIE